MFSPRPSATQQQTLLEQFAQEREKLRQEIAQQLRQQMSSIIGHQPTADLLLVSADGRKMPAHLCILKRRAPSFFQRYVHPTLEAITPRNANRSHRELLEIAVGDVDSGALEFFVRSIYTDDEIYSLDWVPDETLAPNNGRPDENGPDDHGGHGFEGIEGQQNLHTTMPAMPGGSSLTTTNARNFGREESGRQHAIYDGNMPEMLSASFPSPSSPNPSAAGLISFRELATASKSSSQQQFPMDLPIQRNEEVQITSIQRSGGHSCQIENLNHQQERQFRPIKQPQQQSASIFPYFVNIGNNGSIAGECPTSLSSSVMTRSLPSAPEEQIQQRRPGSQSSFGSGLEMMAPSNSIRSRAIAARRLSASSANSLTSIDLPTPGQEFPPFGFPMADQIGQGAGCSKLGEDLLRILEEDSDSADARLIGGDGEELAHTAILWASGSEFFRQQIAALKFAPSPGRRCKIELRRFTAPSLHILLQFIYGGISALPAQNDSQNSLDLWELVELGAFTKMDMFIRVIVLHMRATLCHFFHRPCASCVSAVFDALPKIELEIPAMKQLFDEAMCWQAANFTRIWKGRVFLHLAEHWQKRCRDALLQTVDEENAIDVLLGCEKLQLTLPRIKLQGLAQKVLKAVNDVEEYCMEFLVNSLDSLIQSNTFSSYGRGLALNLTLLEDILPPMIHSLSAETTIRAFLAIKELLLQLDDKSIAMESRDHSSSCSNSPLKKPAFCGSNRSLVFGSNQTIISAGWRDQFLMDEWNPRFKCLCRRLFDLLDQHMLHYANSIVNSTEWEQLNAEEQNRIREYGLFVEMRMPRVAPPRLSSAGRSYKRSSSVGFAQLGHLPPNPGSSDRSRSLERNNSLRFGGHAGSRPSLSTQMEEECCESPSSRNEQIYEEIEEQEMRQKKPEKKENEASKVVKSGTKIPAKIGKETNLIQPKRKQKSGREDFAPELKGMEPNKMPNLRRNAKQDFVDLKKNAKENVAKEDQRGDKEMMELEKEEKPTKMKQKIESKSRENVQKDSKEEMALEMHAADEKIGQQNAEQSVGSSRQKIVPKSGKITENAVDENSEKISHSMGQPIRKGLETNAEQSEIKMKQKIERKVKEEVIGECLEPILPSSSQREQKSLKANAGQKEGEIPKKIEPKLAAIEKVEGEKCKEFQQNPPIVSSCPTPPIHPTPPRPSNVPQMINERQRTHTVMTVDQNLRAGINAYLESVGPSIGPIMHSMGIQKNGSKPQSIVRPMPKVVPTASTTTASSAVETAAIPSEVQRESRRKTNPRQSRIGGGQRGSGGIGQQGKMATGIRRPIMAAKR